jgi:hypothetical protein
MSVLVRLVLSLLLATTLLPQAVAQGGAQPSAEQELVAFTSDEGIARLARAVAKVDFADLANQFEAQANSAFCGPATAAMVLNAVRGRSRDLPRDRGRLRTEDLRHFPSGYDPSLPRFTQDTVIAKGQKTRAQVLGEPININGKEMKDFGYQLRQFDELLRAHDLVTRISVVDDRKSEEAIREDLVGNLKRRGDYVVVNYRREVVGQRGGGHISPLGAYDADSDSFLVLDVNPASAGWIWLPAATLIRAMRTFDKVENRGYIQVAPR